MGDGAVEGPERRHGTDKPAKPPCIQGDTASLSLMWGYIGQGVGGRMAYWASIGSPGASLPQVMGLLRTSECS